MARSGLGSAFRSSAARLLFYLLLGLSRTSLGQVYTITATFNCPYYIRPDDGEWDLEFHPENRQFRPCYGLHVMARQPGIFGDSVCGEDYTGWNGSVKIRASTDCAGDVHLDVEAASLQGFRIGTHDFPWWKLSLDAQLAILTGGATVPVEFYDFLVANATFDWKSPSMTVEGGTGDRVSFGTWNVGDTTDHNSAMAADLFTLTSLVTRQMEYSNHLPESLAVTINHPVLGTPTTIWNTVLYKDSDARNSGCPPGNPNCSYPRMVRSIAHEVGHATYNRYHSGQGHWLLSDSRFYIANHRVCEALGTLRFAWYEGFADFIESYVYPGTLKQQGPLELTEEPRNDPYYHLFRGCYWDTYWNRDPADAPRCTAGASGFDHEGNVQAMLDQIYDGPYRRAYASDFDPSSPSVAGMRARDPHRPDKGQLASVALPDASTRVFSLPAIAEVFGWVEAAGTDAHTAREFLDGQILPWCATQNFAARYCSSGTFQSEMQYLDASSSLPPACPGLGPVGETAGTPIPGTNVNLRFLDATSSPVDAIHFGSVTTGQTKQATVTLVNSGTDPVSVDALFETDNSGAFQLTAPAIPLQLGPDAGTSVTVTFAPRVADYVNFVDAQSTLLRGLSIPGGSASLRLDGSACAPGDCACADLSTDPHNCGKCGVVCLGQCVAGQCAPLPTHPVTVRWTVNHLDPTATTVCADRSLDLVLATAGRVTSPRAHCTDGSTVIDGVTEGIQPLNAVILRSGPPQLQVRAAVPPPINAVVGPNTQELVNFEVEEGKAVVTWTVDGRDPATTTVCADVGLDTVAVVVDGVEMTTTCAAGELAIGGIDAGFQTTQATLYSSAGYPVFDDPFTSMQVAGPPFDHSGSAGVAFTTGVVVRRPSCISASVRHGRSTAGIHGRTPISAASSGCETSQSTFPPPPADH